MVSATILPKGMNFTRVAIALAWNKGNKLDARGFAEARWGPDSVPAVILKAAVAAGGTTDPTWASSLAEHRIAAAEFVDALRPLTILGRLTGYRRVPTLTRVPRATSGSTVGWVGQSKPIAVSRMSFDSIELDPFKLAGIIVSTIELVKLSTPAAEGLVRADLLAAVALMLDRALLDPTAAAVAGVSPASITNGAAQFPMTSAAPAQVLDDLGMLFEQLTGNGIKMLSPYFVLTPKLAFKMALMRDPDGGQSFPALGARGGEIAGVPAMVSGAAYESDDSPSSSNIVLFDAAELIVADTEEIMLDMSTQATVQLNDAPDNPASASTVLTSLWQHNLAGWRVVRPINWIMRRPGAVAVLTGVNY